MNIIIIKARNGKKSNFKFVAFLRKRFEKKKQSSHICLIEIAFNTVNFRRMNGPKRELINNV